MTSKVPRSLPARPALPPSTESQRREADCKHELEWVGNGGWRARDAMLSADDARCVIAYLECTGGHVDVTWINPFRPQSTFPSLRDAYTALTQSSG